MSISSPWKHPKTGVYYHRVDVPKDLKKVLGKTTIKFSLHTKSLDQARSLFVSHYAKTLQLFESARDSKVTSSFVAYPAIDLHPQVNNSTLKSQYPSLSHVIKLFIEHKIRMNSWGDDKTRRDVINLCDQLTEFMGEAVSIGDITREQLREFAVVLSSLPSNYSRQDRFKGMSLREVSNTANAEGLKRISSSSLRKKLVFMKALFSFAEQEELVDKDRAKGISLKNDDPKKRLPFTDENLRLLLPETKCSSTLYWMTRIALTTGMRSNEILQLTVNDIKKVSNIWVFDINTNLDVNTGKLKKVKRENSERLVPIPQVLLDIDFIEFVKGVNSLRVFNDVKVGSSGSYSSTFSRRFTGILKKLGIKPDSDSDTKLDFHSLRHTFRANARAFGISSEIADLIGGWKDQSSRTSGDDYGVHYEAFIGELKRNIDLIDYRVSLK